MNYIRKERGQQRDKRHWGISACGDPRCSDYIHRKTEEKKVSNALDVPMQEAVRLRTDPAAVDPVLTQMK